MRKDGFAVFAFDGLTCSRFIRVRHPPSSLNGFVAAYCSARGHTAKLTQRSSSSQIRAVLYCVHSGNWHLNSIYSETGEKSALNWFFMPYSQCCRCRRRCRSPLTDISFNCRRSKIDERLVRVESSTDLLPYLGKKIKHGRTNGVFLAISSSSSSK